MKSNYDNWKSTMFVPTYQRNVPEQSGVYAVVEAKRKYGLLTHVSIIYIGKSKNLRRRFREHNNPWSEHNEILNKQTMLNDALEFWYLAASKASIDELERSLIKETQPTSNKIRYED